MSRTINHGDLVSLAMPDDTTGRTITLSGGNVILNGQANVGQKKWRMVRFPPPGESSWGEVRFLDRIRFESTDGSGYLSWDDNDPRQISLRVAPVTETEWCLWPPDENQRREGIKSGETCIIRSTYSLNGLFRRLGANANPELTSEIIPLGDRDQTQYQMSWIVTLADDSLTADPLIEPMVPVNLNYGDKISIRGDATGAYVAADTSSFVSNTGQYGVISDASARIWIVKNADNPNSGGRVKFGDKLRFILDAPTPQTRYLTCRRDIDAGSNYRPITSGTFPGEWEVWQVFDANGVHNSEVWSSRREITTRDRLILQNMEPPYYLSSAQAHGARAAITAKMDWPAGEKEKWVFVPAAVQVRYGDAVSIRRATTADTIAADVTFFCSGSDQYPINSTASGDAARKWIVKNVDHPDSIDPVKFGDRLRFILNAPTPGDRYLTCRRDIPAGPNYAAVQAGSYPGDYEVWQVIDPNGDSSPRPVTNADRLILVNQNADSSSYYLSAAQVTGQKTAITAAIDAAITEREQWNFSLVPRDDDQFHKAQKARELQSLRDAGLSLNQGPIQDGVYYNIRPFSSTGFSSTVGSCVGVADDDYKPGYELRATENDASLGRAQFRFADVDNRGRRLIINRDSGQVLHVYRVNAKPPDPVTLGKRVPTGMAPSQVLSSERILTPIEVAEWGVRGVCRFQQLYVDKPYRLVVRTDGSLAVKEVESGDTDLFVVTEATSYKPPETPGTTVPNFDSASDYIKVILKIEKGVLRKVVEEAEVPLGSELLSFAWELIFPERDPLHDMIEILKAFRADILDTINKRTQGTIVKTASKKLTAVRQRYLIDYVNDRKSFGRPGGKTTSELNNNLDALAGDNYDALSALLPTGIEAVIEVNDDNTYLMQAGFPLYVLGAVEHLNLLQEAALINAYDPARDFAGEIDTLRTFASTHFARIEKMYNYLLAWRGSKVERVISDFGGELRDQLSNKTIFSGGNDRHGSLTADGEALRRQYLEHLSFNCYNYNYPYWKQVQKMQKILDETVEACKRLRADPAYRESFGATFNRN